MPRTAARAGPWSLEPTRALLDELGHPERHYAAIHVGGTNAKGSVAVLMAAALRAEGRRVALYTSPHLVDVRERMLVDACPIGADAFAAWTWRLAEAVERTGASFFEVTTAIAFADAAARGADVLVAEVGLGGRLDATNVLDPLVSVVTHVSRDHSEYLGRSLEQIAREKAGIAKPGRPFVTGETDGAVLGVLSGAARERGATLVAVPAERRYAGPLRLAGAHQRRNAAVAAAALARLPADLRPSAAAVERGFAAAWLPGRYDRRGPWIFDVAHNPGAMAVLVRAIAADRPPRPLHALVAILNDKAWDEMLPQLAAAVDGMWLTVAPSAPPERRWDPAEASKTVSCRTVIEPEFDAALRDVQGGAATVLVTGSFHTVGDALARLPGFTPLG